uniref:RRM domain-containing protein n=1 Tax=Davidia involucrata TaxID=16924 RepID=A0A5B7BWP5_DAVIN
MAFFGRLNNFLEKTGRKIFKMELASRNASIYQAKRGVYCPKIFIGGLSYSVDEVCLRQAFSAYGQICRAIVIRNIFTGKSRGFGFINFMKTMQANAAIQAMNGQVLQGRKIFVIHSRDSRDSLSFTKREDEDDPPRGFENAQFGNLVTSFDIYGNPKYINAATYISIWMMPERWRTRDNLLAVENADAAMAKCGNGCRAGTNIEVCMANGCDLKVVRPWQMWVLSNYF